MWAWKLDSYNEISEEVTWIKTKPIQWIKFLQVFSQELIVFLVGVNNCKVDTVPTAVLESYLHLNIHLMAPSIVKAYLYGENSTIPSHHGTWG